MNDRFKKKIYIFLFFSLSFAVMEDMFVTVSKTNICYLEVFS